MATLNVKNLPDDLYERLRACSGSEHRSIAQQVISDDQNRTGNCDCRSLFPSSSRQPSELCTEVVVFGARHGVGRLHQDGLEVAITFDRLGRAITTRTFIATRSQPCPGNRMTCGWESAHIDTKFRNE